MERSRVTLTALMAVVLYSPMKISGAEVELRVRPGDNVTLYCDCVIPTGFYVAWFRNCSHVHQPPLIMHMVELLRGPFRRYSIVYNTSSNSYELLIKNVTEADLGLYYCASWEKKITDNGKISSQNIYHYGSIHTRLSLTELASGSVCVTSWSPPVEDCSMCWKLLISVCPMCVLLSSLLSSTCVYCLCTKNNTDVRAAQKKSVKMRQRDEVGDEDLCYATLEIQGQEQRHLKKKKRVQNSVFSTYSEVRTDRTFNTTQQDL